jgi:hypothetical protein
MKNKKHNTEIKEEYESHHESPLIQPILNMPILQQHPPEARLAILGVVVLVALVMIIIVLYHYSYNICYNLRALQNSFLLGVFWSLFFSHIMANVDVIAEIQQSSPVCQLNLTI